MGNQAISNYIKQQLEVISIELLDRKEYNAVEILQRNSVDFGMDVVKYLDTLNNTKFFDDLIYSETWSLIIEECEKISKSDRKKQGIVNYILESKNRSFEIVIAMSLIKKGR